MKDAWAALPRVGRVTLIDLVRCPSHEARVAYPSLVGDVVRRLGGRIAWSGSIDQQLVGRGLDHFGDVLISELPTAEAALHALAERRAWQPETFVSEMATWAARPWSVWARLGARTAMSLLRLRGGAPEPFRDADREALLAGAGASPVDPESAQLEALIDPNHTGRVVMLNFLRYRAAGGGGARSGEAAYAAYGRIAASLVGRMGGRVRYLARRMRVVEGDPEAPWDALALVEYPSRAAFLGMLLDPRYRAGTDLRREGLDSTQLLVCTAHAAFY